MRDDVRAGNRARRPHDLKNHLCVIVTYCNILLAEMPENDTRRPDILEIDRAARSAVSLIPEVANRIS